MRYLVVGRQPWNKDHFDSLLSNSSEEWLFCDSAKELACLFDNNEEFRFVFFLHWSEKIPARVIDRWECVCFHMTDVPYGRGGSPLQNLIALGHRDTVLTALKMTEDFDAGPVYLKHPLSLEGSTAEEIYVRASLLSCQMALEIANNEPIAQCQSGEPTTFRRRQPAASELATESIDSMQLFDHIRMLDAHGYPPAYIISGNFRFEFSRASFYHDGIQANVKITKLPDVDGA
jgi:methionyl-tRNA formyltransferase